ncbi:hypothetical protein HK405_003757 [Cladochytrium tenue]|nr:hypothetical protein HK405_003757 [Cladochytrium tenue]
MSSLAVPGSTASPGTARRHVRPSTDADAADAAEPVSGAAEFVLELGNAALSEDAQARVSVELAQAAAAGAAEGDYSAKRLSLSAVSLIVHRQHLHRAGHGVGGPDWIASNKETQEAPEPPSLLARLGAGTRRFWNLVLTGGLDTGEEPNLFSVPSDDVRKKMVDWKESVWSVLVDPDPTPWKLYKMHRDHNDDFEATNGYDMYLERGAEGENILHWAMILQKVDMMKYILGLGQYASDLRLNDGSLLLKFPPDVADKMIHNFYESARYWGEHACHLAVVCFGDDITWLRALVMRGADCEIPRAKGSFFQPNGTIYMGETVLAFAACMGHRRIVKYLLEEVQVDPLSVDSYGNTTLHVLAWWGYYSDDRSSADDEDSSKVPLVDDSIYDMIAKGIHKRGKYNIAVEEGNNVAGIELPGFDEVVVNVQGETPLILAVKRNKVNMVKALVRYRVRTLWKYGPIGMNRIPLTEIDTVLDDRTMRHETSALLEAVKTGVILLFLYMVLFSAMIWLLPNDESFFGPDYANLTYVSDAPERLQVQARWAYLAVFSEIHTYHIWDTYHKVQIARFIIEVSLVLWNIASAISEGLEWSRSKSEYFTGLTSQQNLMQWINMLLFTLGVILRISGSIEGEDVIWGWSAILGWLYLLYFSKGFYNIGAFRNLSALCIVLIKILSTDLLVFVALVSVFIIGFGQAIWIMMAPYGDFVYSTSFSGATDAQDSTWRTLPGGLLWSIRFFFSQGSYDDVRNAQATFALVLYLVFFFVVNLLLINIFIAMLNQRFADVLDDSKNQARLLWANLILEIDELINARHRKRVQTFRRHAEKLVEDYTDQIRRAKQAKLEDLLPNSSRPGSRFSTRSTTPATAGAQDTEATGEQLAKLRSDRVEDLELEREEKLARLHEKVWGSVSVTTAHDGGASHRRHRRHGHTRHGDGGVAAGGGETAEDAAAAAAEESLSRDIQEEPISRMGIPRTTRIVNERLRMLYKSAHVYDFLFEVQEQHDGRRRIVKTVATVDESSPLLRLDAEEQDTSALQRKVVTRRDL